MAGLNILQVAIGALSPPIFLTVDGFSDADGSSFVVGVTFAPSTCGNATAEAGEDCDGGDLAGNDCTTVGCDSGVLTCNPDCTFDTSGCFCPK